MGQPASGTLHLVLGGKSGMAGQSILQLVDLQGRILQERRLAGVVAGTRLDLPLNGIADGIYLLRLQSEGNPAVLKKVLVQGR
jgi:hypothetical protein